MQTLTELTDTIERHLAMGLDEMPVPLLEEETQKSIDYLLSEEAIEALKKDPYWPKWNSTWWHITLMFEFGQAEKLPRESLEAMAAAINNHYLRVFPSSDELPADDGGGDVSMYVACHCAVGTMYRILSEQLPERAGELLWMRRWMVRYQLADGGLNCDEQAYAKTNGKSSIVSTLPPLEALMYSTAKPLDNDELRFLDRGAQYLIDHRLGFARASSAMLDARFFEPAFPRFYEYDVLRGLDWLSSWALARKSKLDLETISPVVIALSERFDPGSLQGMARHSLLDMKTRIRGIDGSWRHRSAVSLFPLLHAVVKSDTGRRILGRQWTASLRKLKKLIDQSLVVESVKNSR